MFLVHAENFRNTTIAEVCRTEQHRKIILTKTHVRERERVPGWNCWHQDSTDRQSLTNQHHRGSEEPNAH